MSNGSPPIATDPDVVPQAQPSGFELFLREQRRALVNFLRLRTVSREDAEDAAQESLVRLLRYRESKPAADWKPLLYRIAGNVANDQARLRSSRHAAGHESLNDDVHAQSADTTPLDEQVAQQEELALIWAVIMALPSRCREVYLLNRMDDMSYTQIARHLDISVKAVEKNMARALVALRQAQVKGQEQPQRWGGKPPGAL